MEMKASVVLYPSSGFSHLVSIVELGKLILAHNPLLTIPVFIPSSPYNDADQIASYINGVAAVFPSLTFHHLARVIPPPPSSSFPPFLNNVDLLFELPRLSNPHLLQSLKTLLETHTIKAFIMDFFCTAAFDVSESLQIPTYYFYASAASALICHLYLPALAHNTKKDLKDFETQFDVPGLPPIPYGDLPLVFHYPTSKAYMGFVDSGTQMLKSSGIIANTLETLEARALASLRGGFCTFNSLIPSITCIGPLVLRPSVVEDDKCLTWLSSQPSRSVVFLSFGSMGSFAIKQLKEIATGLENSGHRFLWVVRNPPDWNQKETPDLDSLLPKGFIERTKDKGFVINSWVPQVAILNHVSVGGFVTHCGWNSILEAISGGVPMLAWPLYAEQQFNKVFLVEEFKLGLPVETAEDGFVSAAELEKKVRELMDSENGKEIGERIMAMKDSAVTAMGEGGSSRVALAKLVESWI